MKTILKLILAGLAMFPVLSQAQPYIRTTMTILHAPEIRGIKLQIMATSAWTLYESTDCKRWIAISKGPDPMGIVQIYQLGVQREGMKAHKFYRLETKEPLRPIWLPEPPTPPKPGNPNQ